MSEPTSIDSMPAQVVAKHNSLNSRSFRRLLLLDNPRPWPQKTQLKTNVEFILKA